MTIAEFLCDNLCWMGTLCIALDVSSQQAGATAVISPCLLLFLGLQSVTSSLFPFTLILFPSFPLVLS